MSGPSRGTAPTLRSVARCLSGYGQLADTADGPSWAQVDRVAEKHEHATIVSTEPAR